MVKRGKRFKSVVQKVDPTLGHNLTEALVLIAQTATAKFDETVDAAFRLGIDPKKSDQKVRGTVTLPHGTGKVPRVAVFAKGEKAQDATEAGADVVGAEDLVEKIDQGWSAFDILVATPDVMKIVSKLGKKLGPRMPNAKSGTVTMDVRQAVAELKRGKVEYRVDKACCVHSVIGKVSFGQDKLAENFGALLDAIMRSKPSSSKGQYLKAITLSSTMGPPIRLDTQSVLSLVPR